MASRRRSSTATKPAAPPPNVPMLPLPDSPEIPHQQPRTIHKDLEDPPPPSVFHTRPPPDDPPDPKKDRDHIAPEPRHDPRIPSSRRALTRALELAREAVQLDSTNEEPEAAIMAYGRSVALLSQVIERVRRGEDSTESRRRNGRPRSAVAQEEEVRGLQNIHDTYADRMNILSIIYHIPPIPYSVTNEYAAMAQESSSHSAGSALLSPTSDPSLHIPPPGYTSSTLDDHPELPSHIDPLLDRDSQDPALSLFDSDRAPPEHISHSYAAHATTGLPLSPNPNPYPFFARIDTQYFGRSFGSAPATAGQLLAACSHTYFRRSTCCRSCRRSHSSSHSSRAGASVDVVANAWAA
ncbi:hypothetical protein B0H13DRAFT_307650 [Mycena leptocephala]|nr:hypothetical protein B0H13DRAFT_307650 [Mycena leptocephala]